jgi:hypothetical protein
MDYSSLSDSVLDDAYAAAAAANDSAAMVAISTEIVNRLATVSGFLEGMFGVSRFPKYEQLTSYSQSGAARSSVADAAGSLATQAENAAKTVADYSITGLILLAIIVGGAVYLYEKNK